MDEYIYGKNDEVVLPLASLVKIMTIVVSLKLTPLDSIIEISKNAISQNGDTGLYSKEKWNLADLTKFTLVSSSNDGVFALSENIEDIVSKMNEESKLIGMTDASFLNTTGLDIDKIKSGAYASAKDANIMAINAFKAYPDIFSSTIQKEIEITSESGILHKAENTDTVIDKIPNILFSKTGYTLLAGGNLTIIFKNKIDQEIAITILGSTIDGRFSDMVKLINVL